MAVSEKKSLTLAQALSSSPYLPQHLCFSLPLGWMALGSNSARGTVRKQLPDHNSALDTPDILLNISQPEAQDFAHQETQICHFQDGNKFHPHIADTSF